MQKRSIFNVLREKSYEQLFAHLKNNPKSINELEVDHTTSLHYVAGACPYNKLRLPVEPEAPRKYVKLVIDKGRHLVDERNIYGRTPLHTAAETAYYIMVSELLKQGATTTIQDYQGRYTPFLAALRSSATFDPFFRVEKLLLKKNPSLLEMADHKNRSPLFSLLHSVPEMVTQAFQSGNSLHSDLKRIEQIYFDNLERKVCFLLDNGASTEDGKGGYNALELCLRMLDPVVASPFLQRYQDTTLRAVAIHLCRQSTVDKVDENGWTALHWAVYKGCSKVAADLLERGQKADRPAKNGLTPLNLCHLQSDPALHQLFGSSPKKLTPKSAAAILPLLPHTAVSYYRYQKGMEPYDFHLAAIFNTGLARLNSLLDTFPGLYTPSFDSNILRTPMGHAIARQDILKVKKLAEEGWNAMIDNDFLFYEWLRRSRYSQMASFSTFSHSLNSTYNVNATFYREVMKLLSEKKESGVTPYTEFVSAFDGNGAMAGKALTLFEMGFSPDRFKKESGIDFTGYLWQNFCRHGSHEKGLQLSHHYPQVREVVQSAKERGWL